MFQLPAQPSVWETRRSISFSFLVFHCTDTHIYVHPLPLTLSVVQSENSDNTFHEPKHREEFEGGRRFTPTLVDRVRTCISVCVNVAVDTVTCPLFPKEDTVLPSPP